VKARPDSEATSRAAERHPHLAAPRRAGCVRVDMHMHTMWSGDATTTPDELAEAVSESGLDVLCITDHSTTNGAISLQESGELGCRVVVGQELRTWAGELIGLFLTERIEYGVKPEEFVARVREQGGIVYVPHPFDPIRHCMKEDVLRQFCADGLVDAIEVLNGKTSLASLNAAAASLAAEFGLPGGAGSDAHEPSALGAAYVEVPDFGDAASFLAALGSEDAVVVGHHYDAPRRWRPRIVPSTKAT
jgi:predicted metal-dependent phosphoesterase TrpH